MEQKLVIATTNINKIREIKSYLGDEFEILSLLDFSNHEEVDEPFVTFEENAKHKAVSFYNKEKIPVIAEDSGIIVDSLAGKHTFEGFDEHRNLPSVFSARYASLVLDDPELSHNYEANNKLVLKELEGKPVGKRSARYISVFCFYDGDTSYYFKSALEGFIAHEEKGINGFAYDSIFVPIHNNDSDLTYAEMKEDERLERSHRVEALRKTVEFIKVYNKYGWRWL